MMSQFAEASCIKTEMRGTACMHLSSRKRTLVQCGWCCIATGAWEESVACLGLFITLLCCTLIE